MEKISTLLGGSGEKVLLHHTDTDGICSAAFLLKFFKGFRIVPRDGPIMDDRFLRGLTGLKPDLIVVLDIPVDQEWKKISQLMEKSPKTRLVVIDHHVITKNLNSSRIIHINPRFGGKLYIPASVLVYRMLKDMKKDVSPYLWIAAMGVVGDYAYDDCRDVLDEYGRSAGRGYITKLEKASSMVMSALILHGLRGVIKSLEAVVKNDSLQNILDNEYLLGCDLKVGKEVRKVKADFRKRAREYPELGILIYRIKSRLNIASTISTMLAARYPEKIILITKHSKQAVKISARYQKGDMNLNDLMRFAVEGIGSGGGHEKAAGAVVGTKDFKEFERRLVERVKELKGA